MEDKFGSLVRDSSIYIKELFASGYEHVYVTDPSQWAAPKPSVIAEKKIEPPFTATIATKRLDPPAISSSVNKAHVPHTSQPILQTNWPLLPLPLPEETETLFARFSDVFPKDSLITQPNTLIYLLLPEEKEAPRLFLENVSRVITRTLAPASVLFGDEKKCEQLLKKEGVLIIAPLSLLKKKFPSLAVHQFYPAGHSTLLPLEELDYYLKDLNLKRTLWNTLKTFRFQNTPPLH